MIHLQALKMYLSLMRNSSDAVKPVSYTHLDVYKRQLDNSEKYQKASGKNKTITDAIYEIGNIEYCNFVMQKDEISG